jgi:probable addiction module antidote protein
MATKTTPFDVAKYLDSAESQADLLEDAVATGDANYIAAALGIVARARGMGGVAKASGVTRDALYKSLTADGDPRLSTVLGVAKALGYRIKIEVAA